MSSQGVTILAAMLVVASSSAARAEEKSTKYQLPPKAKSILAKASRVELISLEPTRDKESGFHGWKVLGRVMLKDGKGRSKAIGAIRKGIAESDGKRAKCFEPRHALRATAGKESVDLVICFKCYQIVVHAGRKPVVVPTTKSPLAPLNAILRDADVPLSKK